MLASIIRTGVSKVIGALVGLALAVGVVVPAEMSQYLTAVLTVAVVGAVELAYYVAGRAIEQRYPRAGMVLLAAGLTSRAPDYRPPLDPGTVPGYRQT